MDKIKIVDLSFVPLSAFKHHLADCITLTHDNKILLQKHAENDSKSPGIIHPFGGHVEPGETIAQAVIRELAEETGAKIDAQDLHFIGAVSEAFTNHTELVHVYFWHDKANTLTGCYEREPALFNTCTEALAHPKLMDYARWVLEECQQRKFIK